MRTIKKHLWVSGLVATSVAVIIWNGGLVTSPASHQNPTAGSDRKLGPVSQGAVSTEQLSNPQQASDRTSQEDAQLAQEVAEFLFGPIFQEAQRKQNAQNRQAQQAYENFLKCSRCGGQGNYRYVDNNGILQSRSCPICLGSGKK